MVLALEDNSLAAESKGGESLSMSVPRQMIETTDQYGRRFLVDDYNTRVARIEDTPYGLRIRPLLEK